MRKKGKIKKREKSGIKKWEIFEKNREKAGFLMVIMGVDVFLNCYGG